MGGWAGGCDAVEKGMACAKQIGVWDSYKELRSNECLSNEMDQRQVNECIAANSNVRRYINMRTNAPNRPLPVGMK